MGKGDDFERDVSRMLSLWWTEGKRDDIFWRTSASGGRATARAEYAGRQTKYEHGDVTFTDPVGKPLLDLAVIEAKRGYTNTSRRIKAADMDKVCQYACSADASDLKKVRNRIQSLFSKTKKGGGLDLLDLVDSTSEQKRLQVNTWIRRAELDRAQAGVPYFILIGRRDGHESFVMLPIELQGHLEDYQSPYHRHPYIYINLGKERYYLANAKHWFDWLCPDTVIAVQKVFPTRRLHV